MDWKRVSILAGAGSSIAAIVILKMYGGPVFTNAVDPFNRQVAEQIEKLNASSPDTRARAAESLGYLRAYSGAEALEKSLQDKSANVRRASALALAWCGGRPQVIALLKALEDEDWSVGQAASVALNNLTGLEPHFDAMTGPEVRREQAARWSRWWAEASKQSTPFQILALLQDDDLEARLRGVRALGAIGGPKASANVSAILNLYAGRKYQSLHDTEKHLAEACIHSLGRLRSPDALPLLIGLLDNARSRR